MIVPGQASPLPSMPVFCVCSPKWGWTGPVDEHYHVWESRDFGCAGPIIARRASVVGRYDSERRLVGREQTPHMEFCRGAILREKWLVTKLGWS